MPRIVHAEGKTFTFPDDATTDEISSALNEALPPARRDPTQLLFEIENIPFYKDGSVIAGGIFLLAILIAFFLLKKFAPAKLANLYSVFYIIGRWIARNFQKILIIAAVAFTFWMFRYEVTATHPHQCLDRWTGEVTHC